MPIIVIPVADLEASGPILDVNLCNSLTGQRVLQQQQRPVAGSIRVQALVDTGADMSVIAVGLASQLSLTFIGFQFLAGGQAGGPLPNVNLAPEYSARVEFPNAIGFDLTVLEIALPGGLQMLIGRDVLANGLFFYEGLNNRRSYAVAGSRYTGWAK